MKKKIVILREHKTGTESSFTTFACNTEKASIRAHQKDEIEDEEGIEEYESEKILVTLYWSDVLKEPPLTFFAERLKQITGHDLREETVRKILKASDSDSPLHQDDFAEKEDLKIVFISSAGLSQIKLFKEDVLIDTIEV